VNIGAWRRGTMDMHAPAAARGCGRRAAFAEPRRGGECQERICRAPAVEFAGARSAVMREHRRMYTRVAGLLLSLLAAASVGCAPAREPVHAPAAAAAECSQNDERAAAAVTVVFVRHGEKATDDPRDPSLSPAGVARAAAVAAALRDAGVTHLFASEYRRTQATLGPLAAASGRAVTTIAAGDGEALLAALRGLPPGSVAVVAGHSNTLPGLIRGLAGGDVEAIGDDEYDRMFVVVVPASGPARVLTLRYGA
jgi:phosphohistidine phosphatase SixA